MRRAVPSILAFLSVVTAGCGLAVAPEPPDDGGPTPPDAPPPLPDTSPIDECTYGVTPPPPGEVCAVVLHDHVCADVPRVVACYDGRWVCPVGSTRDPVCWCIGDAGPNCFCTESGWVCAVDAGGSEDAGVVDETFACGPLACTRYGQYCRHDLSDIAGVPDSYACRAYTTGCEGSCSCFLTPGGPTEACTDDGAGGVTVLGGGA